MTTATHTFHADVENYGLGLSELDAKLDCEVGYYIPDWCPRGCTICKIAHVTIWANGKEILPLLNRSTVDALAKKAAGYFIDAKDADVFGVESI